MRYRGVCVCVLVLVSVQYRRFVSLSVNAMSEAIAPKQEWSQSLKANNDTVGGRPVLHENALKTGPISPLVASKPLKKSQSFGKLKGNESLLRSGEADIGVIFPSPLPSSSPSPPPSLALP